MTKRGDKGAVRPSELAAILGLSKGRVSQLTAAGMPKRPDGLIDVAEAEAWVAANVERRTRQPSPAVASIPATSAPAATDYAAIRAEHEDLKSQLTALRLAAEAGTTVRKDKAQAAIFGRARLEREAHENFVVRTAPLLAAELGVPEAKVLGALDTHMRRHLEDLARLPLEIFDDADEHDAVG